MKSLNLRLSDEQSKMLEFLAKSIGMSKTACLSNMIQAEYEALQGNPKLREAYELMNKMNELLKGQRES